MAEHESDPKKSILDELESIQYSLQTNESLSQGEPVESTEDPEGEIPVLHDVIEQGVVNIDDDHPSFDESLAADLESAVGLQPSPAEPQNPFDMEMSQQSSEECSNDEIAEIYRRSIDDPQQTGLDEIGELASEDDLLRKQLFDSLEDSEPTTVELTDSVEDLERDSVDIESLDTALLPSEPEQALAQRGNTDASEAADDPRIAQLIDELVEEYLPLIEFELRSRLQQQLEDPTGSDGD